MEKQAELERLGVAAVTIAAIEDRTKRHAGGQWLNAQCVAIDDEYRITGGFDEDAEVALRAVIKILFEYILHDCIEEADEDWGVAMGIDERGDESVIQQIMKGS